MRIVNRETFLKLPANTLFSKYDPQFFHELMIKGETTGEDYFCSEIADGIESSDSDDLQEQLILAEDDDGIELAMDFDTICRDGLYEKGQLFAVWSKQDVEQLIVRLTECL